MEGNCKDYEAKWDKLQIWTNVIHHQHTQNLDKKQVFNQFS